MFIFLRQLKSFCEAIVRGPAEIRIIHQFKSIFFDLELTIIVGLKLTIIVDNINPLICLRQLMLIKCQLVSISFLNN